MKEAKPVFRKESLLYEREEKESYLTIISKTHPEAKEVIINPTARKILELADGTRTIEEIEMHFTNKYPEIYKEKIKADVLRALSSFTRLGVIDWEDENPFLYKYEEPLTGRYYLCIGQEDNLKDIESFIGFAEEPIKARKKLVLYKNPVITPDEYTKLKLRKKLFDFSEEFFLLRRDSGIEGLISIALPSHPKELGAVLKLIICPENFFKDLFKYSKDYFPYLAVRDVLKIKFYETNMERVNDTLKNFLLEEGFKKEGELKDELGFGKDLVIYSLGYTQEFIEKAKEARKKFI